MDQTVRDALPELPGPYGAALGEACQEGLATYDARALIVGGSILRGAGHTMSDFDIVLIHDKPWRQRAQYWANGVPVELFVNPEAALRVAMQREVAVGRQVMVSLLRAGVIVLDRDGVAARLCEEAETLHDAGPKITAAAITQRQYRIACLLDDACDIREIDPDRSRSLLVQALDGAAELSFLRSGRWQPRTKLLYDAIDRDDPLAGVELREVLKAWSTADVTGRARTLLEHLAGVRGFFVWRSEPEDIVS